MPVTAAERYRGRSGNGKTRQIVYLVKGTDDDQTAIEAPVAVGGAPLLWNGLKRETEDIDAEQLADSIWLVTVPYATPKRADVGEASFEFNWQAASEQIFYSLETVNSYAASGTPPDFKQAINVQLRNGLPDPQGITLPPPRETFSYTFEADPSVITPAYILGIGDLCQRGVKNSTQWTDDQGVVFPAETARLVSVRGSISTAERWSIRFGIDYQKNESGLVIGDVTGIAKKGHDLIWVLTEESEDQNKLVRVPSAVYVERVFAKASFAALGFGTAA